MRPITQGCPLEYEVYTLFRTGELLLQQGRLGQAIRAFQRVIAARPELGAGHLEIGECYRAAGKDDLVRAALQKGLELDPRTAWAALALQELEGTQGPVQSAITKGRYR